VRRVAVREADPVGVVEDRDALERAAERGGVVEGQPRDLDLAAERIRPVRMAGEGPHPGPAREEQPREVATAVAEGTRDRVDVARHDDLIRAFRIF